MLWLRDTLINRTLIGIMDGSFNRHKAKSCSGLGWILVCTAFERQSYWVLAMKAAQQVGRRADHKAKLRGASHQQRQAKAHKPCVVYDFSRDLAVMNHKLQLGSQPRRQPHHSSTDTLNPSNKRRKLD
jgi:hypothetical protein